VRVEAIEADYLTGLSLVASRRRADERMLLLFLGSTIGNFEREDATEFIRRSAGDSVRRRLLLGTDLVKPAPP